MKEWTTRANQVPSSACPPRHPLGTPPGKPGFPAKGCGDESTESLLALINTYTRMGGKSLNITGTSSPPQAHPCDSFTLPSVIQLCANCSMAVCVGWSSVVPPIPFDHESSAHVLDHFYWWCCYHLPYAHSLTAHSLTHYTLTHVVLQEGSL